MTCKMAAGQQKKRLSGSNLHEQHKGKKKKKLYSSDYMLSLRPHIHLEWDDSKKRATAKKEQIGITWTDMAPFLDSVPQYHSGLADVLFVPQEIFDLENLKEVLSYEVWATCLSESERKLLTQFLPSGTAAEQAIHSLLVGENHHFANPFLKWSSSLCSGNLHPDYVLRKERQFKTNKKAYYAELNQYHTDMIEDLKKWKEKWASCRDPEKLRRESTKLKQETLPISAEKINVTTNSKKESPLRICARNDDTAKYMSYIKISKKQFELVKNLKHSGDGIQCKSLTRVIGDISGFHIKPFEAFEEDEKKRLREHWLLVVNEDLPVAFEKHRGKIMRKEGQMMSLKQELTEKRKHIMEKMEMAIFGSSPRGQIEDKGSDCQAGDMIHNSHDHHLECIPCNSHQELCPIALDEAVEQDVINPSDNCPALSYLLDENRSSKSEIEPRASVSRAKDMWREVSMRDSDYLTTTDSHQYMASGELSLRQPQAAEESRAHMIDLERDILEHEAGESVSSALHRDAGDPLFYSYASQTRNELLPPFPKEPEMLLVYPHEHMNGLKQPASQLMAKESLSHSGRFSHQFLEQHQLIEQRQNREENFMHQVMTKNVYSNGKYPNQGLMSVESHPLVPLQPPVNGLVGHSWFPEEQRVNSGWSGIQSHGGLCLGDGGSVDGSLFSVLSGCKNLPSQAPYNTSTPEQLMQARNYVPGGIPNNDDIYAYAPHQVKSSNGHYLATNPADLNRQWLNYQHTDSSMHDSISRSFTGSWKE